MSSNHLRLLSSLCVDADMRNKPAEREALGWALARLNELTGTKVAHALAGNIPETVVQELADLNAKVIELDSFINFICYYAKVDRSRLLNQFQWRQSLNDK